MPPGVVTLTSCAPALPAGATAVICVAEIGVTTAAFDPPNVTALGLPRFVPVMVTTVPPSVGPDVRADARDRRRRGVRELVGGLVALVPPAVVTVTSTAPAEPAGAMAMICVAVLLVIVAVLLPNLTPFASRSRGWRP